MSLCPEDCSGWPHFYPVYVSVSCRLFGLAIGISSFLNLLLPGAADVHYMMVIIVRVLQGLVEVCTMRLSVRSLMGLLCVCQCTR